MNMHQVGQEKRPASRFMVFSGSAVSRCSGVFPVSHNFRELCLKLKQSGQLSGPTEDMQPACCPNAGEAFASDVRAAPKSAGENLHSRAKGSSRVCRFAACFALNRCRQGLTGKASST